MSTSRNFDRICAAVVVLGVLLTILFMNGAAFGIQSSDHVAGYENRLFDASRVHSIDLVVDDWEGFLEDCEDEEYVTCAAVIDGESYKNIALRAKGNTSLSSVRTMGSSRFSFKLEFDHFNKNETYHGLDKLCLNNIIQDNTYMKDFLTYRLMADFGVDTPLCSYVYITVNGEDWGLYLAVEGVEDAFLQRNYGNDSGELYKPDSMSMGGGRGNGREFDMDAVLQDLFGEDVDVSELSEDEIREKLDEAKPQSADGFSEFLGGFSGMQDGFPGSSGGFPGMPGSAPGSSSRPDQDQMSFGAGEMPAPDGAPAALEGAESFTAPDVDGASDEPSVPSGREGRSDRKGPGGGGPGGFGMGSDDVKLRYIDDDPDSYSAIFNNAKTLVTEADKARLISSLRQLSEQTDLEQVLDIDEVLRYFVVHNFVVNSDSYTGSMIHNYYLHESDGKLSMIPWDYNLAFGSFQAGNASGSVNDPIDTPLSVGSGDSRPMADWIFASEEYTDRYHELFAEFLESFDLDVIISETAEMIAPYVEKDPTKFCTYEEFETGVEVLRQFCALRSESVRGQLDGTIPSTDAGQNADSSALVDVSGLTLSALGSMNNGGGFNGGPGDSGSGFPGGSFPGGGSDDSGNSFGGGFPGGGPDGSDSGSESGFPGGEGFPANAGGFSSGNPDGSGGGNPDGSGGGSPDDSGGGLPGSSGGGFPGSGGGGFPGGGFPGGSGDGFPGGGGFPGGSEDGIQTAGPLSQADWIMIAACFAVVLAGILFAGKYRCSK